VVIADNDSTQSARQVVSEFVTTASIPAAYCLEPQQNIALARNKAVENSKGDFIAFIDDDEYPSERWLLSLFTICNKSGVDGVLGPVKPYFQGECPEWVVKGRFCERPSHPTGTVLSALETRTGNVLLKRRIFDDPDNRFGSEFGRTGGEDIEFFSKVIKKGCVFVWCDEAPVYEAVPPDRWKASYYVKRYVRFGGLTGEKIRKKSLSGDSVFRILALFGMYSMMLPFAVLFGKHVFMKCATKGAYNFAWLAGYCGFVIHRYRDDAPNNP